MTGEIMGGDGLPEERVAQIRRVAPEGLEGAHLIHGAVEGADHRLRKRLRHISDTETDDLFVRVRVGVGCHFPRDRREEVAAGQLLVVFINLKH